MELTLQDFPYTGERRPFDWFMEEPEIPAYESVTAELATAESYKSLVVATLIYMSDRRANYVNYMRKGKLIFQTLVPLGLKDKAEDWSPWVTERLGMRTDSSRPSFTDWVPHYEIQRLWITTGIHWSWLELAWLEAETIIWDSSNERMKKKLERVF